MHATNTDIWREPTTDSNLRERSDSHIIGDVLVDHFQIPCPEGEERGRQVKPHLEGALISSAFNKHVKSLLDNLRRHPVATKSTLKEPNTLLPAVPAHGFREWGVGWGGGGQ